MHISDVNCILLDLVLWIVFIGWKQGAKILGLATHGEKIEEEQRKVATVLEMLARDFHDFKVCSL